MSLNLNYKFSISNTYYIFVFLKWYNDDYNDKSTQKKVLRGLGYPVV